MRKLMELNFFDKGIFATAGYWGISVKHNLSPNTPTMYLAKADTDNKQKRKWHARSITNCYCRTCDTLMVIPGVIENLLHRKSITCPSCGHEHKLSNILIAKEAQATLPLYIKASLLELKECIRLKFAYEAVILGENIYNDFAEHNKVTEQFDFLYSQKRVIWKKTVNEHETEREIGFYTDLLKPLQSILQYIPYSAQDKKGRKMSELVAYMRNYLMAKMKAQGYSKRNLFFYTTKSKMLERNLLYLARKIRFWDESETNELYKADDYQLKNGIKRLGLPLLEEQEGKLSNLIQQGLSYLNAFLATFSLPNTRLVRKNLSYANVYSIHGAYSIGDEGLANNVLPYFALHHHDIPVICGYYNHLAKYYPQKHVSDIISGNLSILEDTVALFRLLSKENLAKFEADKPRFKDLHDYLSVLVSSQTANEINYPIPEHILRRLDMQIRNSNCKVLTKYSQILKAGIDLQNCAASYKKRINDNLQLVLVSDDRGKAKVLLEIRNQSIVQAKLWDNKKVKTDEKFNNIVREFAERAHLNIGTDDVSLSDDMINSLAVIK